MVKYWLRVYPAYRHKTNLHRRRGVARHSAIFRVLVRNLARARNFIRNLP